MRQIAIKGYRLGKDGKIQRDQRRLSVSLRLKQQGSRKIPPLRRGALR